MKEWIDHFRRYEGFLKDKIDIEQEAPKLMEQMTALHQLQTLLNAVVEGMTAMETHIAMQPSVNTLLFVDALVSRWIDPVQNSVNVIIPMASTILQWAYLSVNV